MSVPQPLPAQVPTTELTPNPNPTPVLFQRLRECQEPGAGEYMWDRIDWVFGVLNEADAAHISNSGMPELIGLACRVVLENAGTGQGACELTTRLLTEPACLAMTAPPVVTAANAERPEVSDLAWAVLAAGTVLNEEAKAQMVRWLLSTPDAAERYAREFSAGPGALRMDFRFNCMTAPVAGALADSGSAQAIGDGALAVLHSVRDSRTTVALMTSGACATVAQSGNVQALANMLRIVRWLPEGDQLAVARQLLTPSARAALAASTDVGVTAKAALALARLPPGTWRDTVLAPLILPASGEVAARGNDEEIRLLVAESRRLLDPAAREAALATLDLSLHRKDWRHVMAEVRERADASSEGIYRTPGDPPFGSPAGSQPGTPRSAAGGPSLSGPG